MKENPLIKVQRWEKDLNTLPTKTPCQKLPCSTSESSEVPTNLSSGTHYSLQTCTSSLGTCMIDMSRTSGPSSNISTSSNANVFAAANASPSDSETYVGRTVVGVGVAHDVRVAAVENIMRHVERPPSSVFLVPNVNASGIAPLMTSSSVCRARTVFVPQQKRIVSPPLRGQSSPRSLVLFTVTPPLLRGAGAGAGAVSDATTMWGVSQALFGLHATATVTAANAASSIVPPPQPCYCMGTRCEHTQFWRRLRAKKGVVYYVCTLCGAKWRIPTHARLLAGLIRHQQDQNHRHHQLQQHRQQQRSGGKESEEEEGEAPVESSPSQQSPVASESESDTPFLKTELCLPQKSS